MIMKNVSVLFVENDERILNSFRTCFAKHYHVLTAGSAESAQNILEKTPVQVLVTIQKKRDQEDTVPLCDAVKRFSGPVRILLTATPEDGAILDALQKGLIYKCLPMPYSPSILKFLIDEACELFQLKQSKEQLYKEWVNVQEELLLLRSVANQSDQHMNPVFAAAHIRVA